MRLTLGQVYGFFKGISQPLLGALPYGITLFTVNEMVKAQIGKD
jgi:hypothetical protein